MISEALHILVDKADFSRLVPVRQNLGSVLEGHIRVRTGAFALTANNITYMVTGDQIGYWKFFDPETYGISAPDIDVSGLGAMPVWGYGVVSESRHPNIKTGQEIYGFFPPFEYIEMTPGQVGTSGFFDAASHRENLPPIYNRYQFTNGHAEFPGALYDLQPILRPLFTTSFLIEDFLKAKNFFGAEQAVLISASSKTALGTAFCMRRQNDVPVLGLTSKRGLAFLARTGLYDGAQAYGRALDWDAALPTVIIDMAGDGRITQNLYDHFGDKIVYNMMVGKSHWDGAPLPKPARGAPAVMFFAPDQARKRLAQWGGTGFAVRLDAQWRPFCESANSWLEIDKYEELSGFEAAYNLVLGGKLPPSKSCLVTL